MSTFAPIFMGCLSSSQAEIIPFEPDMDNAIAGKKIRFVHKLFGILLFFITPFLFNLFFEMTASVYVMAFQKVKKCF
jgi:hypothetical protein